MAQPTPLIAGKVYTAQIGGSMEEMLCLSTIVTQNQKSGLFRRVNMAFDRFVEGSDDMVGWTLKEGEGAPTARRKPGRPKKTEAMANAK